MISAKKRDALRLLEILEQAGYDARLVGGCVRDQLLGREPKDYDIASSATPEELLTLFKKRQIRTLVYGKEHGTITPIMASGPVEITTLREDVKTHGRHAEVAFHKDFKTDAARRDFTINAMSQDRRGHVFDYFEGKKHLREKRLVFVGEPVVRIQEDYLRILRFFRFQSRFGMRSNAQTLKAIAGQVTGLTQVSHERITSEIYEIFKSPLLAPTLNEMAKTGVLSFVFPGFQLLKLLERRQCLRLLENLACIPVACRSQARIAMLLAFSGLRRKCLTADKVSSLLSDLTEFKIRPSNKEQKLIMALLEALPLLPKVKARRAEYLLFVDASDQATEGMFMPVVVPFLEVFYARSSLRLRKIHKIVEAETHFGWRRKSLPIDGKGLMQGLQIAPGPLVGKVLETLRYAYLDGEWETADEALRWLMNKPLS